MSVPYVGSVQALPTLEVAPDRRLGRSATDSERIEVGSADRVHVLRMLEPMNRRGLDRPPKQADPDPQHPLPQGIVHRKAGILIGIYAIARFALVIAFSPIQWRVDQAAELTPGAPVVDSNEETAAAAFPPERAEAEVISCGSSPRTANSWPRRQSTRRKGTRPGSVQAIPGPCSVTMVPLQPAIPVARQTRKSSSSDQAGVS